MPELRVSLLLLIIRLEMLQESQLGPDAEVGSYEKHDPLDDTLPREEEVRAPDPIDVSEVESLQLHNIRDVHVVVIQALV